MDNLKLIEMVSSKLKETWSKSNSFSELRDEIDIELGFRQIGRGSSRIVYALGESMVLKLAINRTGVAQNKSECTIFSESGSELPTLNKIHAYDEEYFIYEIQDYVNPANAKKLQKILGIDWYEYEDCVLGMGRQPISAEDAIKFYIDESMNVSPQLIHMLKDVRVLKSKYHIEEGDLTKVDSYGIDSDKNIKLIDYGLTSAIWNDFYRIKTR